MQQRVVERPRQHRHRPERHRVDERVDLPEAEVPGEEQRALAVQVGGAHAFLALERHPREHLVGRHRAELEEDGQQAPEVREHPARDGAALGLAAQRKRRLEVPHRQPPVRPIDPVERAADERPDRQDDPHRQQPHTSHDADDREVLDAMPE